MAQRGDAANHRIAFGYEPGAYIGLISPTPLLFIVALRDHSRWPTALAAYERALEPKKLGLCRAVTSRPTFVGFDQSSGPAVEWFRAHL